MLATSRMACNNQPGGVNASSGPKMGRPKMFSTHGGKYLLVRVRSLSFLVVTRLRFWRCCVTLRRSRASRTGSSAGEVGSLLVALDPRCKRTCLHVGVPGDSRRRCFDAKSEAKGEWVRIWSRRVESLPDLLVPANCSGSIPAGFSGELSCCRTGEGVDPADSRVEVPRIIPTSR